MGARRRWRKMVDGRQLLKRINDTAMVDLCQPGRRGIRTPETPEAPHAAGLQDNAETEGFEPSDPRRGLHLSRVVPWV